jgi:hypothetical protein
MKNFGPLWLALALGLVPGSAFPGPPAAEELFTEVASKDTPKYIRINVAGYNVRKDPNFSVNNFSNVDFKTAYGAVFAVRRMAKMKNGTAVNIVVNGQDRWVYIPNWRKDDFQKCDSEACFSDLARVLEILGSQNITPANLAECGIALNPDGSILEPHLPLQVSDAKIPTPPKRPKFTPEQLEKLISPEKRAVSNARLSVKPLWETVKPGVGSRYTAQLLASLHRHGQGLLNTRSLKDANYFCPRYSSLNQMQRQEFWVHLMAGMARYESRFDPKATYDEERGFNPTRGPIDPKKHSQGLFQLSYDSAGQKAYRGFCKLNYQADKDKDISDPSLSIYDIKKQTDCAVGILNYWVKKDGGVGLRRDRGGARFWSTLRATNPANGQVRASLRKFSPCWSK